MVGFNIQNTVMRFPNSFGGGMDISDRSPHPGTCMQWYAGTGASSPIRSHPLTLRCRLNLSRVFRYQFCQRTTNNGIGIENNVPPNRTNRSSPGSSIGSSQSLGALSDASVRSLRSSGDSCAAKRTGFRVLLVGFSSSLPPSGTAVSHLSAVWCMSGAFAVLVYYGVAFGICVPCAVILAIR